MVRLAVAIVVLAGCDVVFPLRDPAAIDANVPDVPSPPDAPLGMCFGTGLVQLCFAEAPGAPLELDGEVLLIDTDSPGACTPYVSKSTAEDPIACALVATSIRIAGTLRATGTRPLVLVSATTFELTGTIDVSSSRLGAIGAGALDAGAGTDCELGPPTGLGGGAGGSFGGRGGAGGDGAGVSTPGFANLIAASPTRLRGGCRGDGGAGLGGDQGAGGGAVAFIAQTITIGGGVVINASGAAGAGGGVASGGGGGGGSGGMILFDGQLLVDPGALFYANGGGGGEGAGAIDAGCPGGESREPGSAALGGSQPGDTCTGNLAGGAGGGGSVLDVLDGGVGTSNTAAGGGGGGGGGGAGVIRVIPFQPIQAETSPPPS